MQGRVLGQVFGQEDREHADQFGRALEPLGHPRQLLDRVAAEIRGGQVVDVSRVEHSVQQLLFGFEVMQQADRGDTGFLAICPRVVPRAPFRATMRCATARIR
jgi:hypothetical protein